MVQRDDQQRLKELFPDFVDHCGIIGYVTDSPSSVVRFSGLKL